MAIYKYKAVNKGGRYIRGRLDAVNESDLESRLAGMDLELIKHKNITNTAGLRFARKRVSRGELINFCFHMEQMTRAGVPLLECLRDLRDSLSNQHFREIISAIIVGIEGGKTLSEALGEFPKVFDKVFISLIQAGEHAGELDKVLRYLTDTLKWQDEITAVTKKIMTYPLIVGVVILGVTFFMMTYLVPQMVNFVKNMGGDLPLHTKILLVTSNFFIHYWYVLLGAPPLLYLVIKSLAHKHPSVRFRVDNIKLRAPVLGPILNKIILTRFATYFALLYRSGITILQCLKISEDIAGNAVVKDALVRVGQYTADGVSLSQSIAKSGLFPPLVIRMLRVGENTGRIDEALDNVSYFYNREVKESIERAQTMIGPIFTVILGLLMGWIMLSVLGPIYDIMSKIKT